LFGKENPNKRWAETVLDSKKTMEGAQRPGYDSVNRLMVTR